MTAQELARLVLEMRAAQMRYFSQRLSGPRDVVSTLLSTAKRLEKEVDQACQKVLADTGQRELF